MNRCAVGTAALVALAAVAACDRRAPPPAADPAVTYAGVAAEVAADEPVTETFPELHALFLRRKVGERDKNLAWQRYRGRWVRWHGTLVSMTANGATFRMLPTTPLFDCSVQFEDVARARLAAYRPGDDVTFVARLATFDDVFRTMYLNHGDLAPRGDGGAAAAGK